MKKLSLPESLGRRIARQNVPILAVSALLVIGSLLAATRLGVDTEIANMLPPDNPVARSYTGISDEFESTSSLIVVVEGESRDALLRAAESFSVQIKEGPEGEELVRSVRLNFDRSFTEKWGLMLSDADELADTRRILSSTRLLPLLRETNDVIEEKLSDGDDEEVRGTEGEEDTLSLMSTFGLFSERLTSVLTGDPAQDAQGAEALADAWVFGEEYMIDPEERTLLLEVKPRFTIGDRNRLTRLVDRAKAIGVSVAEGDASRAAPVRFAFTGDIANEAAEEEALESDVFYPSIVAFLLIVVLFYFSFTKKRAILFALTALVAGIVVDLGFAALAVGKLNMITSSFGALLVGLGIDFGIHVVARYDDAIKKSASAEEAMGSVFREVFMPVAVGGLTTAIAFYSLIASRTSAFRDFGLIAGTGILTTLAASLVLLPAMLAAFSSTRSERESRARKLTYAAPLRVVAASARRPIATLVGCVIVVGALAFLIPNNSFEYDMRKIGPRDSSSKRAENLVAERFDISTWQHFALVDSPAEARELSARYEKAPFVRSTESIADFIPTQEESRARLSIIAQIRDDRSRDKTFLWDESSLDLLSEELQRLEWNMIELGDLAAASLGEASLPVRKRNAMIREIYGSETGKAGKETFAKAIDTLAALIRSNPSNTALRLARLDEAFSAAMDARIGRLSETVRPLELADLPQDLRAELATANGKRFLVRIQGAADLAGDEAFMSFADSLSVVRPDTAGALTLGLALTREISAEAGRSALLVAILVFAAVAIGFRSARLTLAASLGFVCAFIALFGLSPWVGKFNIVNILALPLIIGIGIDYCVHVISALTDPDDPKRAMAQTVKSVTLSMLTTLIGFGSLALVGQFTSVSDLGKTLSLGIVACYLAAIVIVPAIMALGTKK